MTYIERDGETGKVLLKECTDPKTGELHCTDGPALTDIEEFEGRVTRREAHYIDGMMHRDNDECAYIVTDLESGTEIISIWYHQGKQHRAPGPDGARPAYIKRDPKTGVVVREEYKHEGLRHRVDGPAVVLRDATTGQVMRHSTFSHGRQITGGGNSLKLFT